MRDKIIEILKERYELPMTLFRELIPEAQGETDMIFTNFNYDINANVLIAADVSDELINTLNDLLDNKIVEYVVTTEDVFIKAGAPCYPYPIVKERKLNDLIKGFCYKRVHWMPVLVRVGANFK
jgi:hypothetical protein